MKEEGEKDGRGDWIRTSDHLLPKQIRYQTALHPDVERVCLVGTILSSDVHEKDVFSHQVIPLFWKNCSASRTALARWEF